MREPVSCRKSERAMRVALDGSGLPAGIDMPHEERGRQDDRTTAGQRHEEQYVPLGGAIGGTSRGAAGSHVDCGWSREGWYCVWVKYMWQKKIIVRSKEPCRIRLEKGRSFRSRVEGSECYLYIPVLASTMTVSCGVENES